MKILLYGVGSEYVLNNLANFLRNQGHDVTEFIYFKSDDNILEIMHEFERHNFIFITSAHLTLNFSTLSVIDPVYASDFPNLFSPLQIICTFLPKISIYIPHDLAEPYGPKNSGEQCFYDIFDFIISPSKGLNPLNVSEDKVIPLGWIKNINNSVYLPKKNKKIVYFVSNFNFIKNKYTPEKFFNLIKNYENFFYIKFPDWPGVKRYEKFLNHNGIDIIPSSKFSTDIIKGFQIILTDQIGSIFSEAKYFGKPCYYLQDDELNPDSFNPTIEKKIKCTSLKKINNLKPYSIKAEVNNFFDFNKINELIKPL
tara:strand:- start:3390 stop:4322 length:933 start_codon:yes stop_codon:yes gene_type:complete